MKEARDPEVEALAVICKALLSLPDDGSRERVLNYAASRFNLQATPRASKPTPIQSGPATPSPSVLEPPIIADVPDVTANKNEIAGIARLTDSGDLKITARDLKAASANDAAIRLAHIVIYANELLKGEEKTSSPLVLVPILKQWRVYDGNTRKQVHAQKGIIREGKFLSLDQHAKEDAKRFIKEVLNSEITGIWSPSGSTHSRTKNKSPLKNSHKRSS